MSKEIKGHLKAARDAIRIGEYKEALKNCKAVIKLDKSNYNAFVFIGKAATEMQQFDQAEAAYRRAIQFSPNVILAWQGLAESFEKNSEHAKSIELIEIYDKLLELATDGHNDFGKVKEIGEKLATLCQNIGQIDKAIATWTTISQLADSQDTKTNSLKEILTLLQQKKVTTDDDRKQLLKYYKEYLNQELDDSGDYMTMHRDYISQLCSELKMSKMEAELYTTIENECMKFTAKFTTSSFPLEILAQLYLRDADANEFKKRIPFFGKLIHSYPTSNLGYYGLGKVLLSIKEYMKAKEVLRKGLDIKSSYEGWHLIAKVYYYLHQYSATLNAVKNAYDCLESHLSASNYKDILKVQLKMLNSKALRGIGDKFSLLSAADILAKLHDHLSNDIEYLVEYSQLKIDLEDIDTAVELCKRASELDDSHAGVIINQAWIHFVKKEFDMAENVILTLTQTVRDTEKLGELYYKCGRILWDTNENNRVDKSKCLAMFLKSARIDPFHADTFNYLGLYYKSIAKDIQRARKCFEKAYNLDNSHDNAAMMLTDTCAIIGDTETAVKICKKVTGSRPVASCKWAWLRLGLHQMDIGDIIAACISFQNAIRADRVDPRSWECLGDAYKERGSYVSAIKAYARCVELTSEEDLKIIYPLYQIASIKHLLSLFDEAITDYKRILEFRADYVPVLQGIAESLFAKAMDCTGSNLFDRMMTYIQQSLNYIGKIAQFNTNLISTWKLAGDCCTAVFAVNKESVRLLIPQNIIPLELQTYSYLDKSQILKAGVRFYAAALRLAPNPSSLWHNVGVNYLRQAECSDNIDRSTLLNALESFRNSIRLNSKDHESWSALGVVACKLNDPALAQHAFIKSLSLSTQNPTSWTNLGILYLQHGNLAHEAFKRSQSADPYYVEAWIGQSLIAELSTVDQSMDLFRHSMDLRMHVEGCLGYASWVCQTIVSPDKKLPKYSQYRNPLKQATDGLAFYTGRIRDNPCAYNLLGILYEQQSLYLSAIEAYNRSLTLLSDSSNEKAMVLRNYCRVLRSVGKFDESINIYRTLSAQDLTFNDKLGLCLTLFSCGRFKESYAVLEEAMKMTIEEEEKTCSIVLKAIIAFAAGDANHSKGLLFQVSQMQPVNQHGLLALAYLAILLGDGTLLKAVLSELMKTNLKDEKFISRYSLLFSAFYKLQHDNIRARNFICKMIHENPDHGMLWQQLGKQIISSSPEKSSISGICAKSARILNVVASPNSVALEAASLLVCKANIHSEIGSNNDGIKKGIRAASKVVFLRPDNPHNWALLGTAIASHNRYNTARNTVKTKYLDILDLKIWACTDRIAEIKKQKIPKEARHHIPKLLSACIASLHRLENWLTLARVHSMIFGHKIEQAKDLYIKVNASLPDQAPEIDFLLKKAAVVNAKNMPSADLASLKSISIHMKPHHWKDLMEMYAHLGMMKAAEYCCRRYLKVADSKNSQMEALLCLAHLALRAINYGNQESPRWLALGQEAIGEIMKHDSNNTLSQLFASLFSYHGENIKNMYRFSKSLLIDKYFSAIEIPQYLSFLYYISKKENDAVLLSLQNCDNNRMLSMMYYRMGLFANDKRYLCYAIHLDPVQDTYWQALHQFNKK